MFDWNVKNKIIAGAVVCGILFSTGFYYLKIYQSPARTDEIYSHALQGYEKGEYQNSYYLFSKITVFSNLKPIAIYHQAECARMIDDDKSALKQYQLLFNNYPKHKLSVRSRYMAAQMLIDTKPKLAKKYFEQIVNTAPDTDYAIASEYYIGVLLMNKYKDDNKIFPTSVKSDVENCFRHYILKAPSGRWAMNAVGKWLSLKTDVSSDDYILMARSCYLFGEYAKAQELLDKVNLSESWALDVKNAYAMKNYPRAKFLTESGIKNYSQYVEEQELIESIDIYMNISKSKSDAVNELLTLSTKKGRDYLLNLKCQNVDMKNKEACYNYLYLKYPNGKFSADALSNIFFAKIKSKDFDSAIKIGKDHLNKFPNSVSAPMVMFWMGKIYEKHNEYTEYTSYYKSVISKYPDTYYAYRAYLRMNRINGPIITSYINPKPVVYPYKYTRNNIIVKLVDLKDYDILNEICNDDEFVRSWVLYKKGDYSHSMLIARDAMEKINSKPDKYDLRWRLVYPINYYKDIKKHADLTGNNVPLMISLIREESYFDPLAQSVVGASGLMQLMPVTAFDISSKYGLGITSSSVLYNPDINLKAGNYYYAFLRSMLANHDVSAIAAYNGGIGSLQKWKNSIYYNDTDEFVEQIPYPETQNYVKKVFRSYWNYIRLYSGNN